MVRRSPTADALQSSSIFELGMLLVCEKVRRVERRGGEKGRSVWGRVPLVLEGNAAAAAKPAALIPKYITGS